jgi:hypothetical protein
MKYNFKGRRVENPQRSAWEMRGRIFEGCAWKKMVVEKENVCNQPGL